MKQTDFPSKLMLIDTTSQAMTGDVLFSFAYDEVQCRKVGQGALPTIHLWRHEKAFVVGLRDSKLPHAQEAAEWLEQQGYAVGVRNSGGAAVPLDAGVVNVSLIIPRAQPIVNFYHDFEMMVQWIAASLQPGLIKVDQGEIQGSYCPGDYDLSVKGKKFCGIAQRRQIHASIISAFVIVEGSGVERARVVRDYYQIATGDRSAVSSDVTEGRSQRRTIDVPDIVPESMASLSELAAIPSAERYVTALKQALTAMGSDITYGALDMQSVKEIENIAIQLRDKYNPRG